ncbi:unnamed protein product [Staurois parvus]|uniref:Uncharacterized protein n=1 Tax=Staurois parvus TaxID=386267 RepID=A0ABN9EL05_9NEOB|nr:unnamed protein product [Staurois parvus]
MQSGKYRSPGNHQTQTQSLNCQTEKHDSSLQSPVAACVTPLHPTLCIALVAVASTLL